MPQKYFQSTRHYPRFTASQFRRFGCSIDYRGPSTQCTADQWPRRTVAARSFLEIPEKRQKSCRYPRHRTVTVAIRVPATCEKSCTVPEVSPGQVFEVCVIVSRSLDVSNGCRPNSHDRETCARSLRATQESRPSPGAFPPAAVCGVLQQPLQQQQHSQQPQQQRASPAAQQQQRCCAMSQPQRSNNVASSNPRPHRPASLDIGASRRCPLSCTRAAAISSSPPIAGNLATPSSAPPACTTRGFFDDCIVGPPETNCNNHVQNAGNEPAGFELNVNVACSPAGNRDFRTVPTIGGACKRTDLIVDPRPHYADPLLSVENAGPQIDHTRSYTSVSLTLRPPSSEPQPPINIRSQGSSLTYSSSSLDPRGFQSRLQISIGAGAVGSVAAARIRPPMGPSRPNSLIPPVQTGPQRPPGLPAGPPSQLPRPTTTMSAPTTPSVPPATNIVPLISLPTTPSGPTTTSPPSSPVGERIQANSDQNRSPLNQVAEHQTKLVTEQLARKERLARELRAEKGRLEAMKKELQSLSRPFDSSMPPQELKRKLRSEIYQLQVECDRLADEVFQWSDSRVPLGETNEEFYQDIYTGQPLPPTSNFNPPPLPSQPPAWQPDVTGNNVDREERDGPSWVCRMCTFDNHPLMNKCEQCDMPRLLDHGNAGTTSKKSIEEITKCLTRMDADRNPPSTSE